jgi:hypothetical protein
MPSLAGLPGALLDVRPQYFLTRSEIERLLEFDHDGARGCNFRHDGVDRIYETPFLRVKVVTTAADRAVVTEMSHGPDGDNGSMAVFWHRLKTLMRTGRRLMVSTTKPHPTIEGIRVNDRMPDVSISVWRILEFMNAPDGIVPVPAPISYNSRLMYLHTTLWRVWYTDEGNNMCRVDEVGRVLADGTRSRETEVDREDFLNWLGVAVAEPVPTTILPSRVVPFRRSHPVLAALTERERTCPYVTEIGGPLDRRVVFKDGGRVIAEVDIIQGREPHQVVYSVVKEPEYVSVGNPRFIEWACLVLIEQGILIQGPT